MAWVRIPAVASGYHPIVEKRDGSANGLALGLDSGKPMFTLQDPVGGAVTVTVPSALTLDAGSLVAASVDHSSTAGITLSVNEAVPYLFSRRFGRHRCGRVLEAAAPGSH